LEEVRSLPQCTAEGTGGVSSACLMVGPGGLLRKALGSSFRSSVSCSAVTFMADWDGKLGGFPGALERTAVPRDPRRAWVGYLSGPFDPRGQISLFEAPDPRSVPARTLTPDGIHELAVVRPRGGPNAPIVFRRKEEWLEVALARDARCYRNEQAKRMWLRDQGSRWKVIIPPPEEKERLLNDAWGLEASPRAEVLETTRLRGELWIRVRVLMGEACEPLLCDTPRVVLGEGWLPAISLSGRPAVWFETYCD
jgi:hypothetical protein